MKREHPDTGSGGGGGDPPPSSMAKGKPAEDSQDAGVDEMLAALGYKVRASDMADVAQKLEQLEMAMGSSSGGDQDDTVVSHLASDTVHYNPSDLSAWLENMLSELNAPPPPLPTANFTASSQFNHQTAAADPDPDPRKKMRTSSSPRDASIAIPEVSSLPPPPPPLPVVVVDPQESGVRLVHTLMACADAIEKEKYAAADSLLKQIPSLAASQAGAMRKVAGCFAEALGRRIYRSNPRPDPTLDSGFSDILRMHFYESCPFLKFAHFTANQAILEAFSGCRRVHVVDLGMERGMQWPALMQALALRPGGPPSFRLTGIAPPQPDNPDALQQVGWKLAQLADTVGVEFEFRGLVVSSLADLEPRLLLGLGNGKDVAEAVAMNSVFELHRLLAQTGAIDKVLDTLKAMAPKIFTMVEQEANHNADRFSERFTEALHYYSAMFDSLEGGSGGERQQEDQMMTEIYLGREICNVVASEGAERTERHQTAAQWKGGMARSGFEPVCLGSDAFKQASMLLALFAGGDGHRVEEREGCLTLGWHTRPLIATSAWRLAGS